jgi:hypothetical protein
MAVIDQIIGVKGRGAVKEKRNLLTTSSHQL